MKKYRPRTYYTEANKAMMWDRWAKAVWPKIEAGFSEQFKAHVNKISSEECSNVRPASN
jgi:hypothetical protein